MKLIHLAFLFLLIFCAANSSRAKKINRDPLGDLNKDFLGMIKLDSNLFYDHQEIRNIDWLEYMYWTRRIFGEESDQYISTIPNQKIWSTAEVSLVGHGDFMYDIGHWPLWSYKDHPIVGITHDQAEQFCEWRSDRVFEYYLISQKVLFWQPELDEENYFSIKNYFEGKYNSELPNPNYMFYPSFRLPTIEEWNLAAEYNVVHCEKIAKKGKNCQDKFHSNYNPYSGYLLVKMPTVSVDSFCAKGEIAHLKGNVSEWLYTKNQTIGGSWKDVDLNNCNTPVYVDSALLTVGFRAVCYWRKIDASEFVFNLSRYLSYQ